MEDETRKLLKLFGVTVTDFENESSKLTAAAAQLAPGAADQALTLLINSTEMCRELNQRWLEITRHVFAAQEKFLVALGEAARKASIH
jgi:hypothetical protein